MFNSWVRKIPWSRKWQPTPEFLLGELCGQRSLVGYNPRGHKEPDMTERLTLSLRLYRHTPQRIVIPVLLKGGLVLVPPWKQNYLKNLTSNWNTDFSHEIKRGLLLGRKFMTNLDSILKSRNITWPTKVRLVKAMVFPVAKYGCESWTVKKAECRRINILNCGVGKDSWESLGLQGDPTSPS